MDHHRWFCQVYALDPSMWGVTLHRLAMRCISHGGTYDCLELVNLAIVDLMLREAQLVEHVYQQEAAATKLGKGEGKQRPGLAEESAIFSGTHRDSGNVMV